MHMEYRPHVIWDFFSLNWGNKFLGHRAIQTTNTAVPAGSTSAPNILIIQRGVQMRNYCKCMKLIIHCKPKGSTGLNVSSKSWIFKKHFWGRTTSCKTTIYLFNYFGKNLMIYLIIPLIIQWTKDCVILTSFRIMCHILQITSCTFLHHRLWVLPWVSIYFCVLLYLLH